MRTTLKRVLDLLREKTGGAFRERTSVRRGLQQPRPMQVAPARARTRS